jgi:ABC-type antimicrobial peptide transport system permease subunit
VVRTEIQPEAMVSALRQEIERSNPHLAMGECTTMTTAIEDSIEAQRLAAQVISIFGGLVLLLTGAGLYGLLNNLVVQRTQEIGIRMALGADRGRVVWMVVRQSLLWLTVGTALGIGLAVVGGRLLESFLFGVSITDPWTIGLVPVSLALCGALAALLPSLRAATINPVEALRAE